MKPIVSWIQISDLHFGHGDESWGWDQKMVLECLRRDAEHTKLSPPNFIFITGDIAYSGNNKIRKGESVSREYDDAKAWIESLAKSVGLGREAVFLVPGNHDVNRTADKVRATNRLIRALREGQDSVDEALADPNDRATLAERFKNYATFAAQFGPSGLAIASEHGLNWTHSAEVAGVRLRLIGLNTALLSADEFDFGKLRLGRRSLASLVHPPLEHNELALVLSHHPLRGGWLADERDVNAWMNAHAHILLSGHVHEPDSEEIRAGSGGSIIRVAAGASHGEHGTSGTTLSHGYNHAAVFATPGGRLILRIWPRRWSEKNKQFRPDLDNIPRDREYSEHEIRSVRLENPQTQPNHVDSREPGDSSLKERASLQTPHGISEIARRLLLERPDHWEVRFFSQALADELTKNDDLKKDWTYQVAGEQPEYYEPYQALKWISSQTQYLITLAEGFTRLIHEALPAAMGPPGEHGDARELFYVASRLADGHRRAINWALSFRRVYVDENLRPLLKEAEKLSKTVVNGVEEFSSKMQSQLAGLFSEGQYQGPPRTVNFELILEAPDTEAFHRELQRVSRLYGI
jgi:predicted MPP superfamily phosphohydrolase